MKIVNGKVKNLAKKSRQKGEVDENYSLVPILKIKEKPVKGTWYADGSGDFEIKYNSHKSFWIDDAKTKDHVKYVEEKIVDLTKNIKTLKAGLKIIKREFKKAKLIK